VAGKVFNWIVYVGMKREMVVIVLGRDVYKECYHIFKEFDIGIFAALTMIKYMQF